MQYRDYGKTGKKVSLLGLGCMRFPRMEKNGEVMVDREKAYELIHYAADNGINYFDTAFTYHGGNSENILGEALEMGSRRKDVMIVTKQPFSVMKTRDDIRKNLESTLKKLRTDYLDVYLIHNINAKSWDDIKKRDIIGEYEKFKSEGLIKHIGFSYHGGYAAFKDILDYYHWDMCQGQHNMLDLDREVTEQAIIDAGKKGSAMVIMEPLRGGGLAGAPKVAQRVYDESPVKRRPVEWAFRYLIDKSAVSTILSGMTTMEQLKDNINIFSAEDAVPGCLTDAEKKVLTDAKKAYESIVSIPCTACEYCLPCPSNVAIPGVFAQYNEGMMFENFDQPRRGYMLMTGGGRDGGRCTSCGECVSKCPQSIAIPEKIAMCHEALKGWRE